MSQLAACLLVTLSSRSTKTADQAIVSLFKSCLLSLPVLLDIKRRIKQTFKPNLDLA